MSSYDVLSIDERVQELLLALKYGSRTQERVRQDLNKRRCNAFSPTLEAHLPYLPKNYDMSLIPAVMYCNTMTVYYRRGKVYVSEKTIRQIRKKIPPLFQTKNFSPENN